MGSKKKVWLNKKDKIKYSDYSGNLQLNQTKQRVKIKKFKITHQA